jgi:hypothetical protein
MVLWTTTKFKYKSGSPRKFYGCSRYPLCDAAHGADPDGRPLGTPANKETKQARIAAHDKFDAYWKKNRLHRNQAYKLLQDIMELSPKDAHIAMFTKDQCEKLCVGDVGFEYSYFERLLNPEYGKFLGGNHDNYSKMPCKCQDGIKAIKEAVGPSLFAAGRFFMFVVLGVLIKNGVLPIFLGGRTRNLHTNNV